MAYKALIQFVVSIIIMGMCISVSDAQTAPVEDEVISRGVLRGDDPAMGAFFSGDYETAEIEFQKNYRRIKRDAMQLRDNIASTQSGSLTAEIRSGPAAVSSGPGGTAEIRTSSAVPNFGSLTKRAKRRGEGVTSGTDAGFQRYMMGMSQLKLRKYAEAKGSFKSAVTLNKSLFDAHLRLGLLELRDGNQKSARKSLKALDRAVKRCRNICEERNELQEARDVLSISLAHTRK